MCDENRPHGVGSYEYPSRNRRGEVENSGQISDVRVSSNGWDIHYGKFVDLSYSIPQDAESEEVFQSIDSGLSWTEASLPIGIWVFTNNGVPMHMVRIAQLESVDLSV